MPHTSSVGASCPVVRCSGSHTGLLEQDRARVTHRSCSLPAPRSSEPQSPFPRPIVITKDLLSRQNVLNRKARRKHPPHLMWEADVESGRNGWGLYRGRPRREGRQAFCLFTISMDQQMLPPKPTSRCRRVCLKCYTLLHFKCLLNIQQDSLRLEKCDSENSRNKRFWKC